MAARPGFWFCLCPDGRLTRRRVDEMLDTHAPSGGGTWKKQVFWGDEEPTDAFWEALTLQGLFEVCRAVVVRRAHNLSAEVWKQVSKILARPNPKVWPLLCLETAWEKGRPKIPAHIAKLGCLKFAEGKGWVWRSPGLDQCSLPGYVRMTAKGLGLALDERTVSALCAVLPADAAAVEAELEKLSLLAGSRTLVPGDADLAAALPECNVFDLVRLLESGRTAEARATLPADGTGGDKVLFPLLGLLQHEARQLWQMLAGDQPRLYPAERERKERLAAGLGTTGLARLWDAVHTAELAVKSGQRTPDQALDGLFIELTAIFGASSSASNSR